MNLFSLQSLSSSPVTSLAGVVVLILATLLLLFGKNDAALTQGMALFPVGIGLLAARQNNTTSEQAGAKPPLP